MKKKFLVGILISSFLVLGSGIANATPIVDQEYDPTGEVNTWSGIGGTDKAQVFTAGLSGLLTGVDVLIRRQDNQGKDEDDLIVDIRNTVGGIPINDDLNTLALVQITALDVPTTYDFYYVDLSAFNMQITAGDMLSIALRTANPLLLDTCYSWEGNANNNSYEGGGHYYRNPDYGYDTWTSFPNGTYDYGFRTYVETLNPVPEPATMLLFVTGIVGLAGSGLRRKKQ
ncbi:PEP-CTERM sorting domain-containing protein [bacterium]|nr:PEP-CTERM sorting domain-containing protein [bacterium]